MRLSLTLTLALAAFGFVGCDASDPLEAAETPSGALTARDFAPEASAASFVQGVTYATSTAALEADPYLAMQAGDIVTSADGITGAVYGAFGPKEEAFRGTFSQVKDEVVVTIPGAPEKTVLVGSFVSRDGSVLRLRSRGGVIEAGRMITLVAKPSAPAYWEDARTFAPEAAPVSLISGAAYASSAQTLEAGPAVELVAEDVVTAAGVVRASLLGVVGERTPDGFVGQEIKGDFVQHGHEVTVTFTSEAGKASVLVGSFATRDASVLHLRATRGDLFAEGHALTLVAKADRPSAFVATK